MQSKFKKSYPPVPPGKRLIFRYSYALGRTIPMFVDDTPEQWKPRSAKARRARHGRRSRTEKALTRAQFPRMSAVTVVPAPTPPPMPHPGAHGDAHNVIGAFAGGARALHQAPAGQSAGSNFLEMLGGALAGAGATRVSAAIGQAMPEQHSNITEGLAEKAVTHGAELAQEFRKLADELGQCAAAESGPNGNGFAQAGLLFLEMLARIGAGAVNGAPAGGLAHLAMVNPTEKNVQRLTSSI